ncbi:MAG TPA: AmmeMemoRadiSam system protein B [Acetobacteraceae bacterium]|nr:AmmeMemoRadiSam system protein B [Acetobacteraceae bacterium]
MTDIRSPAVAGTFYPADPGTLRRQVAGFLAEAGSAPADAAIPKAIIGPHAGYIYSGPVAAHAYSRLLTARGTIRRVVLIGPSHYVGFQGLAVDTAQAWDMPNGRVALDTDAIGRLRQLPMVGTLEAAYAREHALEVHVPFLQHVLGDFRLVPIVAGDAPPDAVAAVFDALWGGPETLFVISTDLSHYLDYAACRTADSQTAVAIERMDLDALGPQQACGAVPTRGMLLAARRRGLRIERLDLRNSGDTAGGRDRVVGYGAWALYEPATAATEADEERAAVEAVGPALIQIARESILLGLNTGAAPQVVHEDGLAPLLAAPGAAFVTLKRRGMLRGCIGSAMATRPLVVDVAVHAFNAAFRDWRFPRLGAEEMAGLSLSVSVLTPPVPVDFADEAALLAQLRPGIDGLIIRDPGHAALFLPSVWEEIREPETFLDALKQKAGIADGPLPSGFVAQRFRSIEVKGAMQVSTPTAAAGWRLVPG